MNSSILLRISTLFLLLPFVNCTNIGIFCNLGWYSHDIYFNFLAENLVSKYDHNVSLIQIRVDRYVKSPFSDEFRHVTHDHALDSRSIAANAQFERLLWEIIMPFDPNNISLIATQASTQIMDGHKRSCATALENQTFINEMKRLNLDLMIIDISGNDCAIGFANMLKIPMIYVTPGTFDAKYFDYIGLPTNPAYVPECFCRFDPSGSFWLRIFNAVAHANIIILRRNLYNEICTYIYEKVQIELTSLGALERRTLLHGTKWDMFFDRPRPLARNVRYFGCEDCIGSNEKNTDFTEVTSGVILVSFGSVLKAENVPVSKLQALLKAFSEFEHYIFVWQLNIPQDYFETNVLAPLNMTMPSNVRLHKWIPIKQLLKDPKVMLIISHGGSNSVQEAVYHGIPMLALAVPFDPYHSAECMARHGLGEARTVLEIEEERVKNLLNSLLSNYRIYKQRSTIFRAMLTDYTKFEASSSFWLDFVARHFGDRSEKSRLRLEKYWVLRYPENWLVYFDCDIYSFAIVVCLAMIRCMF